MIFDADPYINEIFPWDFKVKSRGREYPVRPLRMGDALQLERLAAEAARLQDQDKIIADARAAAAAGAPIPDSVAALDDTMTAFEEGLRKFVGSLAPDLSPPASQWPAKGLSKIVDALVDYWREYTKKNSSSPAPPAATTQEPATTGQGGQG